MGRSQWVALGGVVALLATAGAAAQEPATRDETPASERLLNGREPAPGLLAGGQPSLDEYRALAEAGYRTIITLRIEGEPGEIPAEDVESLGLKFVRIPVKGADGLNDENVRALDATLAEAGDAPTVLHCASGNRVGALLALRAHRDGMPADEALAFGLDAGLTGLEGAVREKLGLSSRDGK